MEVGHFFLTLAVLLMSAKIAGELAERVGQPAVLGELIVGVILGPSVMGLVPADNGVLHLFAEVGICLLLFEIGLETDLKELLAVGWSAFLVACVGVLLPFIIGYSVIIGLGMPRLTAIFTGAILTATSVGITARVLTDLGKLHTQEAKIILGAAIADDILGLIILSAVAPLAVNGEISVLGLGKTAALSLLFVVAAIAGGRRAAPRLFTLIDRMRVRGFLLVAAFSTILLLAVLAHKLGSALIIGSFAAGLVLSRVNQFDTIRREVKPLADLFTPIFFITVGTAVDWRVLNPVNPQNRWVLLISGLLIAAAVLGKVLSGFALWYKRVNHFAIGVGMIPRGEVGLIFVQMGRATGVLSSELFSAVTVTIMVTTFIVPPLLKTIFRQQDLKAEGQ
ncbi:MAG: cation:proton antiporter [Acidobacteria bacterium]|nr:cation:proton antiporter [Acidobacteriota bacterium]MBI3654884.1 cation:proton antiporter [Acidobacteriota bacterium]